MEALSPVPSPESAPETALQRVTVALAGNPNSGKTSIFNVLTGAHQHVGNYPGVTVERKEGVCEHQGIQVNLVDLPGTYSLTSYTLEERVTREFLLNERPDVVVNVVDASNLERNLYLTTQLLELGVPLVLVLNMSDVAQAQGIKFDLETLEEFYGAPVVRTVGTRKSGCADLLETVIEVAKRGTALPRRIHYGTEVDRELERIETALVARDGSTVEGAPPRWTAIKLLEGDQQVREAVGSEEIQEVVEHSTARLQKIVGDSPELLLAERRYGFVAGTCGEAVRLTAQARASISDRIDTVMTHRVLGLPIFLGLMYVVFTVTFTVGDPFVRGIEAGVGWLQQTVTSIWPAAVLGDALLSLVVDGVFGGVGTVIVFLPNILLLFLGIAVLEDSGYMARAAFVTDQLMHRIGLHGKSFIPLIIGFGCSVPAIMATRMLERRRDRLTTMMVVPLMSCSARLTIYALIAPAFFPTAWQGPVVWSLYLLGIVLAVAGARVLRSTLFRGETVPLVLELPPYRMPTLRSTFIHGWERSWLYLKKAGTVILAFSVVLWVLASYPKPEQFQQDYEAGHEQAAALYSSGVAELAAAANVAPEQLESALESSPEDGETYSESIETVLEVRERVLAIEEGFAARTELLAVDDTARYAIELAREAALARLERSQGHQLVEAVQRFLSEVEASNRSTVDELNRAQRSEILEASFAGRIGHAIEPLLRPMGFDWRIGTALIGAFAAKEMFVAQMGVVFAVGEDGAANTVMRERLHAAYSPLQGYCIMLFCLVALPCMATIAVTRRESGSWGWAMFQLFGLTAVAWVLATVVYQVGRLVGIGVS